MSAQLVEQYIYLSVYLSISLFIYILYIYIYNRNYPKLTNFLLKVSRHE